jgi:hypothetical protein
MKIRIHVPSRAGLVGQLDAEPHEVWFRNGDGFLSGQPCYDVRDLLGRRFMGVRFSMAFDDGQILHSCRITTNRGPSSRFMYDAAAAEGPTTKP